MGKWTRRAFIGAGSVVGGGLALGIGEFSLAPNRLKLAPTDPLSADASRLTTWIKIANDNRITVIVPHCEMGQGAQTGLAMMAAEELDAEWNLVSVEEAAARNEYAAGYLVRGFGGMLTPPDILLRGLNHLTYKVADWMNLQVTGGSASIRFTGEYGMRVAGATAKAMVIEAAAKRWQVPAETCTANASYVTHADGHRASYGELAAEAAQLALPKQPRLKTREQFKLLGTSPQRFDIASKVDGTAQFGIDVIRPNMVYAAVKAAPSFGSKLIAVDDAVVKELPGVISVVKLENAVAVVARHYWQARRALEQLSPQFDGVNQDVNSAAIFADFASTLSTSAGSEVVTAGNVDKALGNSELIEAEYKVPYLAHATMEPMNATVLVEADACELWLGTQDPLHARAIAADITGIAKDKIRVNNQMLGGGFGRRLPGVHDFLEQAVHVAKAVAGRPVQLIWSREEDFQHDFYRSAVLGRYQATLDTQGLPLAWRAHFVGDAGDGAATLPYDIPHQSIRRFKIENPIRLGAWRSVDHTQHGFFTEVFIDELAHAAKQDPYAYRRALLQQSPRHLAVLDVAARSANWGQALPAGEGRGIALVESFGTLVCQVVEVAVSGSTLIVKRVVAAVDCGDVVHRSAALAQVEGGILFGLSAALHGEITIDKGAVVQSNFHDHRVLRINEAPAIEVHFIASDAPRGGLGEPGVPPIAPAVVNAIFAATGQRIRSLPIVKALSA